MCHSSTGPSYVNTNVRDKVALPRSNLYPDDRRIGMDQSGGRIHYRANRTSLSQSQPSMHTVTNQSGASNPGFLCYKSSCRCQFVTPQVRNTTFSIKTINSASRNTLSSIGSGWQHQSNTPVRRQIDQLSNTPVRRPAGTYYWSNTPVRRQPISPGSTWTNSPRSLWSNHQTRRQQTRRRRLQRSTIVYAMCVAMRLWSLPVIGGTCSRVIRWIWSRLLWCMTTIPTRTTTTTQNLEPNSDD